MKNGYDILITLTNKLNNDEEIISLILSNDKDSFSSNEELITVALGLVNEIKEITNDLDDEVFILNKKLYTLLTPIINYSNNILNSYCIPNAYKLYDVLKIDLPALRDFLNFVNKNQ